MQRHTYIARLVHGFLTFFAACLLLANYSYSQQAETDEPAPLASERRSPTAKRFIPGRVLVLLDPALGDSESERLTSFRGGRAIARDSRLGLHVIEVPAGINEEDVVTSLRGRAGVLAAELDEILEPSQVTPNDPNYPSQTHLTAIKAPSAWAKTVGLSSVIVAVIDTGVNSNHPDLIGKLVPGWNTYDNNGDASDVYGHGTKVAGTIVAATNNGTGVASICWNCMIMPIRASQANGSASFSSLAAGLTWAADNGARVANISYQVSGSSTVTAAAQYFMQKGGLVFASAGNYSTNDPAADNPSIVTVSGINPATADLYSWSNYGNNIDVTAPGCVGSTTLMNLSYGSGCGTSYSSPIAAGVAALVFSANPNLTATQTLAILKQSATDLGAAGWDVKFGAGLVDAEKAVAQALTTAGPDTKGPAVSISSPVGGTKVKGAFAAAATASDAEGSVSSVVFKVGAALACSFTQSPYSCSIDSAQFPDGAASFSVVATDNSGNSTTVAQSITIENADLVKPSVNLTSPAAGATVGGTVQVAFAAFDDVGVSGITVTAGAATLCTVPGTATSCPWDTTNTANGSVVLMVTARDAAGNSQAASVNVTVNNVDDQPPAVSIQTPFEGASVNGTVNVAFTVSDNVGVISTVVSAGSAVLCSVSGPAASCSWDTLQAPNGLTSITVAAKDAAGNVKTAAVNVTVNNADTVKPTVSISSPVQGATVSGGINIMFAAYDNVGVKDIIVTAGTSTICTLTGTATSCPWNTALVSNGAYTITVLARDAAGNAYSASAAVTVNNADMLKPVVSISNPAEGSTVSGSVNIIFSATDNAGVTGITVSAGGATICSFTGPATSCPWNTAKVANGAHAITVAARDAIGNSQSVTRNVTVKNTDTTAPSVRITSPGRNAKLSGAVTVSFTVADNVGVAGVVVSAGGTQICSLPGTATSCPWSTSKTPNGTQTLTVTARDLAGNAQSAAISVTVNNTIIDTIKPIVSFTAPTAGSTVAGPVNVGMAATDDIKVTKLVLSANGVVICSLTTASGTCAWNTATAPNGGNTLTATAYDAAGNAGVAQMVLTVANTDLIRPTVSFVSPLGGKLAKSVTVQVSANDNVGVANVMVTANGKPICNLGGGNFACTWNTAVFSNGSYSLTATARDYAGNSSSASVSVSVNNTSTTGSSDRIAPMTVITAPAAGSVLKGVVAVNYSAYDNKAVTKAIIRLNTLTLCTLTTATGTCMVDTAKYPDGLHNLVAVAYDAAGNGALSYIPVRIVNTATVSDAPQVLEEPTLGEADEDLELSPEPEPDPEIEPAPQPENPEEPGEPRE